VTSCVFCSIAAGAAPATVLASKDPAFAFLARDPLAPGHTLVVPRRHAADLFEVTDDDLAAPCCWPGGWRRRSWSSSTPEASTS